MNTKRKIGQYIKTWKSQGYKKDIPDETPMELMKDNLAPSYKAICLALLKNDMNLLSLGFPVVKSEIYQALKHIEINRNRQ